MQVGNDGLCGKGSEAGGTKRNEADSLIELRHDGQWFQWVGVSEGAQSTPSVDGPFTI